VRLSAAETDTIAALATPIGQGGLAVIRISGTDALNVASRIFAPAGRGANSPADATSHTLHYGHIRHEGRVIDEVLLAVMHAPRTFTREDVVEISCHGGVFVARQVLGAVVAAGARLALPGEFTRRAFLNGRIDLTQAEAVADLIHARTELALAAAHEQMAGALSRRVGAARDELMTTLAHVEAHIDFPDEDIAPDTLEQLEQRLARGLDQIDSLLATAREGQILRRGISVAIIGRPNAGKSSLLNQLLSRERAIVSPVPGTTRDTIEEMASIRGIPVNFVDTAGLREATDEIEAEGIRRTRSAAGRAELLLHVMDRSEPLAAVDRGYLAEFAARPRILVVNKADLDGRLQLPPELQDAIVSVSCRTGEGIARLKDAISDWVWSGCGAGGGHEVMINARHEDALRRAREAIERTLAALRAAQPLELVASDLRIGVDAIGEIIGKTATEDLLDKIFSSFCIGK
jgi:tRNA modification GTPase